ncbi:30S ribosomal protein S4 [Candidatus Bathyarchaeota archaeon]|nr:30S ribosomal protein S4 [Candidatus Bathyarchaeota archaeon]
MGDPKRQRKKFETPKYPWSKDNLETELRLLGDYGLRNKRELWRHHTKLSKYRAMARKLQGKTRKERSKAEKQLLSKLFSVGLISANSSLADVLDLTIKDFLERRLQMIVFRQRLAKTPHQARQMIVHGHIAIKGKRIIFPSYIVKRDDEPTLTYAPTSTIATPDHPIQKALTNSSVPKS